MTDIDSRPTMPADMPSLEKTAKHDRIAMISLFVGMVASMAVLLYVAV